MLTFKTKTPNALLNAIKKAIKEGTVATWSCDSQGDFTHTPSQWRNKAWLRPEAVSGTELNFHIIRLQGSSVTREDYAVYHGRFIEMMTAHFNNDFTTALGTPNAVTGDLV